MEKTFERRLESLGAVFEFLRAASEELELDEGNAFTVNMAVEELFTNMIKYGAGGDKEILVGLERENGRLSIRLVDYDSEPFDLTRLDTVDVNAPLDKRRPGGLGIHLVKCIMDEVSYEYRDRVTHIRLVKNL